jgi:hypothetical protein
LTRRRAGCLVFAALVLASCGDADAVAEHDSGAPIRIDPPRQDAVSIEIGSREVRVHCGVECAAVTDELSLLHAGCMHDALSTPHTVSVSASLIALGCCTQARASYERACGLEGPAASCASEWQARCERGDPGE